MGKKPTDTPPNDGEFRGSNEVRTALILGNTFGIKAVQYAVVDGQAMFEGDIVLGSVEQVEADSVQLRDIQSGVVAMSVAITGSQFRWPNCVVPYTIDANLPDQARVTDAIAHWEANTRFRFVLRTAQNAAQYPDWLTFRPGAGCSSMVGKRGGQQFITLAGGCSTGSTIHEIGHTIGLWHEQSREDRDTFVTINWANIQDGMSHNFNQHIADGDDIGAYDYGSIMHYGRTAFSRNGQDTITPTDPNAQIGQRNALSAGDIAAANSLCPIKLPIQDIKKPPLDVKRPPFDKLPIRDVKKPPLDVKRPPFDKLPIKDPVFGGRPDVPTRKELLKEPIKDPRIDPIKSRFEPVKSPKEFVERPDLGGFVTTGRPFTVATPRQADVGAYDQTAALQDAAVDLQDRLAQLAEAIAGNDAAGQALQQAYDETAAALEQTLAALDPSTWA